MTAAEVRVPRARLIVIGAAVAVCAAILWLARSYTFYFDEWDFILSAPDWTPLTYLQPHNEHPVMLTRLMYALLLATAGLRTYLPYIAALLVLHGANAVLLFELIRRRSGDLVGMASAALLLLIGAGWENLLWAFQVAFVGAVTFGLAALLLLSLAPTRGRQIGAVLALAASQMFSGIGLFFAAAVAVRLLLDGARRRDLLWFLPLGALVVVWYAAFGHGSTVQASNLVALPAYVGWGLASSAAGLIGVQGWIAIPVAIVAAIACLWRRSLDPLAIGSIAGLLSFYALTGLTRAQFGFEQSGAGRYVYVGAVFWLILGSGPAAHVPWRGTWRPALAACLFLACFNSGVLLVAYAAAKTVQMERQTADLQALAADRGDPCLDPSSAVDQLVMPQLTQPVLYYRAVDRYGDPTAGRPVVDRADFEAAQGRLGCPSP